MRKLKEDERCFKTRSHGITRRISIYDNILEVHSTSLGYPIKFEVTDELREFLRSI